MAVYYMNCGFSFVYKIDRCPCVFDRWNSAELSTGGLDDLARGYVPVYVQNKQQIFQSLYTDISTGRHTGLLNTE